MQSRTYLAIDLKSFYASVECRERDLDPHGQDHLSGSHAVAEKLRHFRPRTAV